MANSNGEKVTVLINFPNLVGQIVPGDFNSDGALNYDDLNDQFMPAYGTHTGDPGFVPECDMNQDGFIDMLDYAEWYELYMDANSQ